jgi:hypothetical protein
VSRKAADSVGSTRRCDLCGDDDCMNECVVLCGALELLLVDVVSAI